MDVPALLARSGADVAEDMHPAFVRMLLAEGSVAPAEVLTRLWPVDADRQQRCLEGDLAGLWQRAPEELVAVIDRLPAGPRAEGLARLCAVDPARFTAAAATALARPMTPLERARGLLALARTNGDRGRVVEAMPLLPGLKIWELAGVARDFAEVWDAEQRAEIRAQARRSTERVWAVEVMTALVRVAPAEEARSDAQWAVERLFDGKVVQQAWRLPALARALPFAAMRPQVDAHLRAARGLWDGFWTVPDLAPLAATDQLDAMVEMIEEGGGYLWDKVRLLALVACHHPRRHAELLARARVGLARIATLPGASAPGDRMPVATVHRVHALAGVAEAETGEARRELQAAALVHLASDAEDYAELETIAPYWWRAIARQLDPTLRERLVEVLLTFADRYTCWGAIAEAVECFPAEQRGLGLLGLRRLADAPREP